MSGSRPHDQAAGLSKLLARHFPLVGEADLRRHAEKLRLANSVAGAFQQIEQIDSDPQKDLINLGKAAKGVRKAQESLSKLGLQGLLQLAEAHQSTDKLDSAVISSSRLSDQLNQIASSIERAQLKLEEVLSSSGKLEDEPHRRGRTRKVQAHHFTRVCANVYFDLTERLPTVPSHDVPAGINGTQSKAYGPFLNFVEDAFRQVGISASAETWARHAAREFKGTK